MAIFSTLLTTQDPLGATAGSMGELAHPPTSFEHESPISSAAGAARSFPVSMLVVAALAAIHSSHRLGDALPNVDASVRISRWFTQNHRDRARDASPWLFTCSIYLDVSDCSCFIVSRYSCFGLRRDPWPNKPGTQSGWPLATLHHRLR